MRTYILRCVAAIGRGAAAVLHAVRRLCSAVAEINRQQRRLSTVYSSMDPYLPHPDAPPDTYREFLTRTRGALLHEPSARARLAGRAVG